MRKFNKGQQIGATKQAARGAADRAYREQVRSLQPKFQPGADPLEREASIKILEPTDAQQLQQMTKMLEKLYQGGTPQEQQALELWKMQVAQGTIRDQVKLDFMRRFYFWLLGRGDQADHDKTLWGRANTAVYNKEVASYIDMFVDKRTKYVMKLRALANNVPDTLNGMYLYYKYIVNGQLKQVRAADGTITYEMSDEDYLQDFDLFQQVFDSTVGVNGRHSGGTVGYSELAAGLPINKTKLPRAFDSAGVPAPINNSGLSSSRASDVSLNASKMEANNTIAVRDRLSLGSGRTDKPARDSRSWEQRRSTGGTIEATAVPNPGDLNSGSVDASGPPQDLGVAQQETRALGGEPDKDLTMYEEMYEYLGELPIEQKNAWLNERATAADIAGLERVHLRRQKMGDSNIAGDMDVSLARKNKSELDDSMPALEPYNGRAELQRLVAEKRAAEEQRRKSGKPKVGADLPAGANVNAGKMTDEEVEQHRKLRELSEPSDRLSEEGKHEEAWEARALALDIKDIQNKLGKGRKILASGDTDENERVFSVLKNNDLSHNAVANAFVEQAAMQKNNPVTEAMLLAMAEKSPEYVETRARQLAEQHERFQRESLDEKEIDLALQHQKLATDYRQRQLDAEAAKYMASAKLLDKKNPATAAALRKMAEEALSK